MVTTDLANFSSWIIQCVSMVLAVLIIPRLRVTSIFGPLLAVAALAFVNTAIWSSDLFLALPNNASLHTAALVGINGAIFWLIVKVVPGIETDGILPSLLAPIVFSLCTLAVPRLATQIDWEATALKAKQVVTQAKKFVEAPPQ
jgi:uncharacterized membrane protein YvlD (DUF360 family)